MADRNLLRRIYCVLVLTPVQAVADLLILVLKHQLIMGIFLSPVLKAGASHLLYMNLHKVICPAL